MSPRAQLIDPELGPLTDDLLTPDVRVYQRERGHRFSSDDVATAYVAFCARPDARDVLDLGCGLGSVLLLLAWSLPHARLSGVEAQAVSYALLTRNVARNGSLVRDGGAPLGERVSIELGDLREVCGRPTWRRRFDLVTGTPPYFPPGTAVDSADSQRAHARSEHRGGVEAYLAGAAEVLADEGHFVMCGDARAHARVVTEAPSVGLRLWAHCEVIPRAGRPALFAVWTLRRDRAPEPPRYTTLTLRDEAGLTTEDAGRLRVFSGFTPRVGAR